MRNATAIAVCMLFFGCTGEASFTGSSACAAPESYVSHVLDTIRAHSIYRDSANWVEVEKDAKTSIAGARSIEQTYRAVDHLLRQSGDVHAWFRRPEPDVATSDAAPINVQNPTVDRLDATLGYLNVPAALGRTVEGAQEYARALQHGIRRLDSSGVQGWIIDLRKNWGGSMWPMIAGLGPLLGNGVAGYFVYPDGSRSTWSYGNGMALLGDSAIVDISTDAYGLKNSNPRIAILMGSGTTSSGEAVVVAFRGLAGVKSFGEETSGMTTAIEGKTLCDGSVVGVSTAAFSDREGRVYSGKLRPDTSIDETNAGDAALQAAIRWLHSETADSS